MPDQDISYGFRPAILPIVWTLTAIAFLTVIARIVTKKWKFDGLIWEDYLMIVAMALAIYFGIVTTVLYGLGLGLQEARLFHIPRLAEYFYIGHAVGFMSPVFARTSFCLYMIRVISSGSATKRCILWVVIAIQWMVNITMVILVLSQCGSFHALWKGGLGETRPASCVSHVVIGDMATWTTSFNAFTDVFLTILPAVVVWNIKAMNTRTKAGVIATLGLSLFASAASVCKAYFTYVLYSPEATPKVLGQVYIVMGVEVTIVIIVASVPILAPLVLRRSSRGSSYQTPVLAEYDVSVEGKSRNVSVTVTDNKPCLELGQSSSSFRHNSNSTFWSTKTKIGQDENDIMEKKNRLNSVIKTKELGVASPERDEGVTEQNIVLHNDRSDSRYADHLGTYEGTSPEQSWENMPTLPFLHSDVYSLHELRQ